MKRSKSQIRQDIFVFLKANGIMTLATAESNQPWVCTLYYGLDDDMNMYVVTDPSSCHGKHIVRNCRVAFNVFDSHQKITELKRGVQGRGEIALVKGLKSITKALWLWHKANPGIEKKITIKDILKTITDTKIYQIKPDYLKFFNKELYGSAEYGIWELSPS